MQLQEVAVIDVPDISAISTLLLRTVVCVWIKLAAYPTRVMPSRTLEGITLMLACGTPLGGLALSPRSSLEGVRVAEVGRALLLQL